MSLALTFPQAQDARAEAERLAKAGNHAEALKRFQEIAAANPADAAARIWIGRLHMEMGEPRRGHVSRTIPPATRAAVLHRDRWCCNVPGCTNTLWLDLHHIVERHRGGDHRESNLITLCSVHHRVVHEGLMAVRPVDEGVEFEFLDGRRATTLPRWLSRAATGRAARAEQATPPVNL